MTMMEFQTAARDRKADAESGEISGPEEIQFKHDGRVVTFYKPSADQFALFSATGFSGTDSDAVGVYLSLFFALADDDTQRYFRGRLMNREDEFSLDSEGGVGDIMTYLIEQWSGRPTKQPSDYRRSRSSTGRSSTARTRAKEPTSLPSPQTDS